MSDRAGSPDGNGADGGRAAAGATADPARGRARKAPSAFRTISEVADELHIPQHVLRFWETRFPQVRPLKRGGGRRYYRPDDIALLRSIAHLLYVQGYTIKGVQRLLREGSGTLADDIPPANEAERDESSAERAGLEAIAAAPMPDLLEATGVCEQDWSDAGRVSGDRPHGAASSADPDGLLREILVELETLRSLLD